jgi:tetratricopeptide (TPR) repeat protein
VSSGDLGTNAAAAQVGGIGLFLAAGDTDDIWEEAVRPAIESARLHPIRMKVDDAERAANRDVVRDANIVIVDLTGSSKELSFSAGLLRGIGKPLVVLAGKDQPSPVDVSIQRVLTYRNTPRGRERLRLNLTRALTAIIRTLNIERAGASSEPADLENQLDQLLTKAAEPQQIAEIADIAAQQAAISTDERKTNLFYGIAARAWLAAGMLDEAEYSLRRALATRPRDPSILANLARVYSERGDIPQAMSLYEDALTLSPSASLLNGSILLNLGTLYAQTGNFERARDLYERAAEILSENSDQLGYATVLSNIGQLLYQTGKLTRARENLERAAAIYQQYNFMQGLAETQRSLVTVLIADNDLEAARGAFRSALGLTKQLNDKRGLAYLELQGASLALREGQMEEVEVRSRSALQDFLQMGDRRGEGIARSLLGQALLHAGNIEDAAEHFGIALEALRETDAPEAQDLDDFLRQVMNESAASDG